MQTTKIEGKRSCVMSQTKDLLLKIRAAVMDGRLQVKDVPIADMKQCVYSELQVNRCTFTEQQYEEILERFNIMCANISDVEKEKDKILLLTDALILCTDMISQAVYALANGEYWRYKHRKRVEDPEINEMIEYIEQERRISLINYEFVKEYAALPVEICLDEDCGMRYIPYKGRRMFFPRDWDEQKITDYYRTVIMEQDERSPHSYHKENFGVQKGDVVVDAGTAEGIFALDHVDLVEKLYLIEADAIWVEALEQTFRDDRKKVQIIHGFLDSFSGDGHVSMDELFDQEEINYIKMDIEGAEKAALAGAEGVLKRCENIRCAICAYHCKEDEKTIRSILDRHEFVTETSKGYMCPDWTMAAYLEAEIRRGIVFGKKGKNILNNI